VITIKDISEEINVSRRTVLREMDTVYKWFEFQKVPLKKVANKGLLLEAQNSDREKLLIALNNALEDYVFSKEERIVFILTELLQQSEPSKLFYFADMLGVSEATVSHDMDKVEKWLQSYNLILERKPGVGVNITGKERNIRKALISIIYDNLDGEQIKSVLLDYVSIIPNKRKQNLKIKNRLLSLMDYETIIKIEKAIDQSEIDMGFKFAESSYTALAVHLALAIKRIIHGDNIYIEKSVFNELKECDEFHIASNLIHSLSTVLKIDIPTDEIAYVTMHLKGAKYNSGLTESSVMQFDEIIISNYKLTSIIYEMIKLAERETGFKLSNDDSLLIGLMNHLRPAMNRLKMNLEIRNPLLDSIKEKYPDIYDISLKCCDIIEKNIAIKVPENEVGYIAMHIGSAIERVHNANALKHDIFNVVVTCTSGIGTSKMLAARLKKEFKNLHIIEVFSTTKVKKQWLLDNNIDLIISTVHFVSDTSPVIIVNPLLLKKDISNLNDKLQSISLFRSKNASKNDKHVNLKGVIQKLNLYSSAIIEILSNFVFVENIEAATFSEFLDHICRKLHNNIDKEKELRNELLRREQLGSVIFPEEKVIMLHTRSITINKITVGVFRNKNEILYAGNYFIASIVLIAPVDIEQEKLEIIGEISSKMIDDPSFLHKIKKAKGAILSQVIEDALGEFFYKYNNKINNKELS
jgi:mannitol operon transcriptional antiterminator